MSFKIKTSTLLCLLIITVVGIFHITTIRDGHDWGDDFAAYIHHAKNISEGVAYKEIGYIFNPSYPSIGPATYPPLFPFILSPVYKLGGLNLYAMKLVVIFFFLLSLLACYLFFEKDLPTPYLVALIAGIGFHPFLWERKDHILSDNPFLFFTYMALFLIDRVESERNANGSFVRSPLLIGCFLYSAYATRSVGLLLIASLIIYQIIKYRKVRRPVIIISVLVGSLILLQMFTTHSDKAYLGGLQINVQTLKRNLWQYGWAAAKIWDNGYFPLGRCIMLFLMTVLAVTGYLLKIKDRFSVSEVFTIIYLLSIVVFPYQDGLRYLIPVIPAYLFCILYCIKRMAERLGSQFQLVSAVSILIFATYATRYSSKDFGDVRNGVTDGDAVRLFEYVKEHAASEDIIIFRKPKALALYTGRRAATISPLQTDDEIWSFTQVIKVNWFIVGPEYLDPEYQVFCKGLIDRHPERFERVYDNDGITLYKMKPVQIKGH